MCDGKQDCADNSDENDCSGAPSSPAPENNNKQKNEFPIVLSTCRVYEFPCKDGRCIDQFGKCDGKVNCADGSDETSETCGKEACPYFSFRCKYGACLSAGVKCNGVQDCADNSDEDPAICADSPQPTTSTTTKPVDVPETSTQTFNPR